VKIRAVKGVFSMVDDNIFPAYYTSFLQYV